MMRLIRLLAVVAFFAGFLFSDVVAYAQSANERIAQLSKAAMEDYDFMEFISADEKISKAISIIESEGITEQYVSQVYVAQGIISYGQLKDSAKAIAEEKAFSSFVKAFSINKDSSLPNDYRSPELEAIMDRARTAVGSSIVTTHEKARISHTGITSSQPCQPLVIEASVPAHPDVYRVKLYYITDSQKDYKVLDMNPSIHDPSILSATIPGTETDVNRIKYYIEALNRQNQAVANLASVAEPLITTMFGACEKPPVEILEKYGDPIFQFSASVGTGFALIEGMTENCRFNESCTKDSTFPGVSRGLAIVPLFVRGDISFNLPANFQIGAYVRGQIIEPAIMAGASLRYVFMKQPYRLYFGIVGGWGDATATINLGKKYNNFVDIFRIKGPGHLGPQFGFLWSFHKNVGMMIDLTVPFHFPKFGFHVDIALGPFFQF